MSTVNRNLSEPSRWIARTLRLQLLALSERLKGSSLDQTMGFYGGRPNRITCPSNGPEAERTAEFDNVSQDCRLVEYVWSIVESED